MNAGRDRGGCAQNCKRKRNRKRSLTFRTPWGDKPPVVATDANVPRRQRVRCRACGVGFAEVRHDGAGLRKIFIALQMSGLSQRTLQYFAALCSKSGRARRM